MNEYKTAFFERSTPAERRLQQLKRSESRRRSWYICDKDFAPIMAKLRRTPPPQTADAGLIYSSSGKYVWRLECEYGDDTLTVAYKTNPGKTPWRYIFNSSLPIREMRNYLRFEQLGIPVAEVFAAGDCRKNFILQETFIVTGFLADSRDGRLFMPGGELRSDREKLHTFCRMNLALLAKLHHGKIFHKAFHPRNLLWRIKGENMEVFWIDVARCRPVSSRQMARAVIVDLHTFFRDMRLSRQETVKLLDFYAAAAPAKYLPGGGEELLEKLLHFRRRLFCNRQYRILDGE